MQCTAAIVKPNSKLRIYLSCTLCQFDIIFLHFKEEDKHDRPAKSLLITSGICLKCTSLPVLEFSVFSVFDPWGTRRKSHYGDMTLSELVNAQRVTRKTPLSLYET